MAGPRTPHRDVAAEIRELLEPYRGRLAGELETLAALLHQARRDGGATRQAHDLAHRLKGTSGTYGLQECSRALARIESLLAELLERCADPAGAWDEIGRELARARAGLDDPAPPSA